MEQKEQSIYETLAAALGGIFLNAEKKKIDVQVDCPEGLMVSHDRKWTTEALFNILDNAVKYTPKGGNIWVSVECWEMYVKIDITDNGIGISEEHQGTIFKRLQKELGLDCILRVKLSRFKADTSWFHLSREKVLHFRYAFFGNKGKS